MKKAIFQANLYRSVFMCYILIDCIMITAREGISFMVYRSTDEKKNFRAMLIEGGFYFTGYTFFDVYAVIPVFIYALTGDIKLAGLAVAVKLSFFMLPQLIMGHYTSHISNIPKFLGIIGSSGRIFYLLIPLVLILNVKSTYVMAVLIASLLIGSLSDGITNVPWLDLLGRTISPLNRSKLLGYQMLSGGAGGLLAGIMIRQVLILKWESKDKYALIFFAGAIVLMISGILLFILKDRREGIPVKNASIFAYISKLPGFIKRNKAYKTLMITQILAGFNTLAAPVYILFAQNHFDLAQRSVSTLMFAQIAGGLAGGFIWGHTGHSRGGKTAIQSGILMNAVTASLALVLYYRNSPGVFTGLLFMVFIAGFSKGNYIGYTNHLFEIVDKEDQPAYIALTNTILFPLTFIPFLGALIADSLGYVILFCTVTFFMIISYFPSTRLHSKSSF